MMGSTQKQKHIGERLLDAIREKGVRQSDVARHFHVSAATVSCDWIKLGRISKKHIPGFVAYFGRPYEYWLDTSYKPGAEQARRDEEQQVLLILKTLGNADLENWIKFGKYLSARSTPKTNHIENNGNHSAKSVSCDWPWSH